MSIASITGYTDRKALNTWQRIHTGHFQSKCDGKHHCRNITVMRVLLLNLGETPTGKQAISFLRAHVAEH